MLTADGCLARRKRLWDSVPGEADWLIITDPRHIHYLCNFWVNPISFSAGESAILVLEPDQATLFADNFTRRTASTTPFAVTEEIDAWYDHKHSIIDRHTAIRRLVSNGDFARFQNGTGYVEHSSARLSGLGMQEAAAPEDFELGNALRTLRRNKHDDEIALMKKCMRACEAGHKRVREIIAPGMTELDVYREVLNVATAAAGRPVVVYGDFRATNVEQHKAGGLPTTYELQPGDLFICDYSVVIDGYRSDFTNTYAVTEASDDQARMALTCIEAIMAGEAALKPDAKGSDVYKAVSGILERDERGPLRHHAGHGLGLSHPEAPVLVPESTDTLMVGDVVTLEPGIYLEGIGGMRFEHNYLITETGFERLSDHVIGF